MIDSRTKFLNHYVRPYVGETPQAAYTLAGLSLLTIIVFGFFALRPAVTSALLTQNSINKGRADLLKFDEKIKNLKLAQDNLTANQAKLAALNKSLPASEDYGSLVETLTVAAGSSGVKLDFYQRKDQDFWVGISGSFNSIEGFLTAVKSSGRLLSVTSVSLNPSVTTTLQNDTQIKATILLRAYTL